MNSRLQSIVRHYERNSHLQSIVRHYEAQVRTWTHSVAFWKERNKPVDIAFATKNLRAARMKLQWANQRAALYAVRKD